jgi:hypothetical protein
VLYGRLKPHANKIVGQYQCGFREEVSTIDQKNIRADLGKKALEFQKKPIISL